MPSGRGLATVLTAMVGIVYFREPLTAIKLASIGLVVIGVTALSLAGKVAH
jgi:small multidrug resistance pump